jgi:hypothetical protein
MVKLLSQIRGSESYKKTIREDLQQAFRACKKTPTTC